VKVVVVDRVQVAKDIKRILARFISLFGVADHREVPLDVVICKNRMTVMRTMVLATTYVQKYDLVGCRAEGRRLTFLAQGTEVQSWALL
jgi:hypothetical protein